jgi:hypothetical protein
VPDGSPDAGDPTGVGNTPDIGAPPDLGSPADVTNPPDLGADTQSAAAAQPFQNTVPDASPAPVHADGGQVSGGGALPTGAAGIGLAAGARGAAGRGADTVRQERRQSSSPASSGGRGTQGAVPLGGRAAGEKDKEHKRKYSVIEHHDEALEVAPAVITGGTRED